MNTTTVDGLRDGDAALPRVPGVRLVRLLGLGGQGEVWLGEDLAAGDEVAIKIRREAASRPPGGRDPDHLERETALLRRIDHPHVVRLRRVVDLAGGGRALVLDLAAGGSLSDLVRVRGPLSVSQVCSIVVPLALTVADLHDRGLVHGDLTPSNVLFSGDGRPLIADLGCARILGEAPVRRWGTDGYADPSAGPVPLPTEDVFALGALARFALTGDPLAPGVVAGVVAPPGAVAPAPLDDPRHALLALLDRCTNADPARRPDPRSLARAALEVMPLSGSSAAPSVSSSGPAPMSMPSARSAPPDARGARHPVVIRFAGPVGSNTRPTGSAPRTGTSSPEPASSGPAGRGRVGPPVQAGRGRVGPSSSGRSARAGAGGRRPADAVGGRRRAPSGAGPRAGAGSRAVRWVLPGAFLMAAAFGLRWWLVDAPVPVTTTVVATPAGQGPVGRTAAAGMPGGGSRGVGDTAPSQRDDVRGTSASTVETPSEALVRLAGDRARAFRDLSTAQLTDVDEAGSPALGADLALIGSLRAAGIRLDDLMFTVANVRSTSGGGVLTVRALIGTSGYRQITIDGSRVVGSVAASSPRPVVLALVLGGDGRHWLVRQTWAGA